MESVDMAEKRASKTSRTNTAFYSKALKAGIASLMDEIRLAFQWSRPSILVAVHKGSAGQEKARAQLRKEIQAINKKVRNIEVNRNNLNVIQSALKSPDHANIVFFVSGIGRNNENDRRSIYRALNFQREILVDNRIILVLWLSAAEAGEIPHLAPDFWAFRHRVVEFAPEHNMTKKAAP